MNTTVKNLFTRFCQVYDLKTSATCKHDNPNQKDFYSNDFIKLDYAPIYGGYRLDIVHTYTGESHFSGSSRKSAKEMISYLSGLLDAKDVNNFKNITN